MPDDCEACGGLRGCDAAVTLTEDGDVIQAPDFPGVVSWPACPMRYAGFYALGGDLVTLDVALDWLIARGAHKAAGLGSGAASLYREHLATRRLGRTMARARAAAEARRAKGRR